MITSKTPRRVVDEYHDEVVVALRKISNPRRGNAVAKDRGSKVEHLGIPFPALRKRVKKGFSFYDLPAENVLAIWDRLWRTSPYGDVLFAALEYYAPLVRKQVPPSLWPVVRHWHERVDNWCHSDGLSSLYSWLLASDPAAVPAARGVESQRRTVASTDLTRQPHSLLR